MELSCCCFVVLLRCLVCGVRCFVVSLLRCVVVALCRCFVVSSFRCFVVVLGCA